MKTTVVYSPLVEYQNTIYNLSEVYSGFFIENGFFYTATVPHDFTNYVCLPRWKCLQDENVWTKIKDASKNIKLDRHWYWQCQPDYIPELWEEIAALQKPMIAKYEELLSYYKNDIDKILLSIRDVAKDFEINITHYGTAGSYSISKDRLIMCVIDYPESFLQSVTFGIGAYAVHQSMYDFNSESLWRERQRAIDTLIRSTKLGNWYQLENSIIESSRKHMPLTYRNETRSFLNYYGLIEARLGDFSLVEDILIIAEKKIHLTKQEVLIVSQLLSRGQGSILSYDMAAEILWGDKSFAKFSLQTISKTVERINKKVKNVGIHQVFIKNKPKMGYYL
ncbi:helix-turn-helix domain-containing protein [Candidatus Woesebacteria bacterium]|nr:helix-turn-helix domain-containing protein [Candidatus Woesebacteria bacterium]